MNNYRFFQFKTSNKKIQEDYCRADNLEHAKKIFKYYYPKLRGEVKEIWMINFNKHNKSFKKS